MAELSDLTSIPIVQVLPGTEYLDGGNARLQGFVEPGHR
jgi:hypothetical protein